MVYFSEDWGFSVHLCSTGVPNNFENKCVLLSLILMPWRVDGQTVTAVITGSYVCYGGHTHLLIRKLAQQELKQFHGAVSDVRRHINDS